MITSHVPVPLSTNSESAFMTAATTTNSACAFPSFPKLAPELRNQIWELALSPIEPTIFYHIQSCNYCSETFLPDAKMFEPVLYEVPLAFVNHEARSIALAWIHKHDLTLCPCDDGRDPMFSRRFNPSRDAVYDISECIMFRSQFRGEITGLADSRGPTRFSLEQFAFPQKPVQEDEIMQELEIGLLPVLPRFFELFPRFRVIFAIMNMPTGLPRRPNQLPPGVSSADGPYRWELIPQPGTVYRRNRHDGRLEKIEDDSGTLESLQSASDDGHRGTFKPVEVRPALAAMVLCRTGQKYYV